MRDNPDLITHVKVPREPLAVSTNRAIRMARGEYLCIWNIDDLRTENSLELMARTLDMNPTIGFTYGDFIVVNEWEKRDGILIAAANFDKQRFICSMLAGPFFMWRRSLCHDVGYWDEQFKCAADFDYAARLTVESAGGKTDGLIGWYLNEGLGLSTRGAPWEKIERTVIQLRYGASTTLDLRYYNAARTYQIHKILQDDRWIPKNQLMPHCGDFSKSKWALIYPVLRYQFWLAKQKLFASIRQTKLLLEKPPL